MNSFSANTATSTTSLSVSDHHIDNNNNNNINNDKPSLIQSTTGTASGRGSIAKVLNRVAARVKRNKNKNKIKNKNKSKNNPKCTAAINCFDHNNNNNNHTLESKETDEIRRFTLFDNLNTEQMIKSKGYMIDKKLADTLQGEVYRCRIIKKDKNINYFNNDTVVIKVTNKDLHKTGMTILDNGHKKKIQENIIKEKDIIRQLTLNNGNDNDNDNNQFITRYIDFFESSTSYFLVIEDGENDLFEYVVKCHNLLRKGKLERKEWRLIVKKIFKQIIRLLDFLHNQHSICHLDISLENMLIKNGTILQNINTGKISLNRDITIKFCDFGLSEQFKSDSFKCTKYVGKTRYKSPELWTKKLVFDARSNDIWSCGIVLFMAIMGAPPIKYPDHNDDNFKLIINGEILQLIQSWNRAKYMTPVILDLLKKMLTIESKRITLNEIKSHPWVKLN